MVNALTLLVSPWVLMPSFDGLMGLINQTFPANLNLKFPAREAFMDEVHSAQTIPR
jgi:hypothetical protein